MWEEIFDNDDIVIEKCGNEYRISFFKDYHFVDEMYYDVKEKTFYGGIFYEC